MPNLTASSHAAYRRGTVMAATPAQQVVLLYDGARRFLRQAAIAMSDGEVERAHTTLRYAERIIGHLDATLDFEQGELPAAAALDLPVLPRPPAHGAPAPGSGEA